MHMGDTFDFPAIDSSEVMSVGKHLGTLGWAAGMLVLILDGKTALAGAAVGVELCLQTLIPSLFPFFVLSAMLTGSLGGNGLLLAGILGGYPVGAGNVVQAYRAGQISRSQAERLVVLCNCAGPSFLFGVITPVLGELKLGLALWGVYLLSVLALWWVLPKTPPIPPHAVEIHLQTALWGSVRAMAGVCGWVVLFRVVLAILDRWILWLLPDWGWVTVYGLLELSNGCLYLGILPPAWRFLTAAGLIGFGGICVMLQTAGAVEGIPMKWYFPGKVFQSMVCILLSACLYPGTLPPTVLAVLTGITIFLGYLLQKTEKSSGNPRTVGV